MIRAPSSAMRVYERDAHHLIPQWLALSYTFAVDLAAARPYAFALDFGRTFMHVRGGLSGGLP